MIHPQATTILPPSQTVSSILTITPKTTNETLLLAALREATADNEALRRRVVESQAANILNEAYCNKLRFQLAAKEEKGKKKGKGKLMGDGLPRMLTGDEFFSTPKPTPEKITRQPPKPKLKDFRPPVEDADDAASDGEALEVEGESSDESDADNDEDSDGDDQS